MADRAQVTSVEAIEAFRADLVVYLSKARPTLEEVTNAVLRTRLWLQNDQRHHWEGELRLRRKKLERAQAELLSAMLSKMKEASAAQQLEVRRAQEAVKEAEAKLALLRRWDRELENRSEPLVKQVDQMHFFLTTNMTRAVASLAQTVKSLEAYAGVALPAASGESDVAKTEGAATNGDSGEEGSPVEGAADAPSRKPGAGAQP